MADTSESEQHPPPEPQTNGVVDGFEEDDRNKMRPADIDADVREMERRKRVEMIMNSRLFREELERIIEVQMKDGNGPAGLLQQISDMMGVQGGRLHGTMFKSSNCVLPINDIRGVESMGYAKGEKILRCKLAAVFRLMDLYGWSQGVYSQISARLNQDQEHFLVNPFGMLFHEITASSLIKIDMQGAVVEQGTSNFGVNVTGFMLNSAIHAARPDIKCIIHVHTSAVLAVSALKCGLLPLCQEAIVIGDVSYHPYLGGLFEPEEREKIARNLGPINKVMILANHGAVCCGETVEEAFFNVYNTVLACETQIKLMPMGVDNLVFVSDETRKQVYEAARRAPDSVPKQPDAADLPPTGIKKEKQWRIGSIEFEALMRMLDNAGFRTGYIYRHPLVKGDLPRPRNDVEVPPAVSSLGYLLEEEEMYRQGNWKKYMDGRKTHDRTRWLNSPNVYQKVEILETGTPDPKKITKWVADGSPTHSSCNPVKIDCALQFVPKNTDPKEFKKLQQQIKDNRRADKITSGPQSHILEGVSWEEAKKLQDANITVTGDQVILVGAASKGIIQRGFQHNAMVYKTPYAKNPFDTITDEEIEEYKKVIERKQRGESFDEDQSESEPLSSSMQMSRPTNDSVEGVKSPLLSPTSAASETEEESRDEPRVLRIETKQVPRPSQAEVVLSDDITPAARGAGLHNMTIAPLPNPACLQTAHYSLLPVMSPAVTVIVQRRRMGLIYNELNTLLNVDSRHYYQLAFLSHPAENLHLRNCTPYPKQDKDDGQNRRVKLKLDFSQDNSGVQGTVSVQVFSSMTKVRKLEYAVPGKINVDTNLSSKLAPIIEETEEKSTASESPSQTLAVELQATKWDCEQLEQTGDCQSLRWDSAENLERLGAELDKYSQNELFPAIGNPAAVSEDSRSKLVKWHSVENLRMLGPQVECAVNSGVLKWHPEQSGLLRAVVHGATEPYPVQWNSLRTLMTLNAAAECCVDCEDSADSKLEETTAEIQSLKWDSAENLERLASELGWGTSFGYESSQLSHTNCSGAIDSSQEQVYEEFKPILWDSSCSSAKGELEGVQTHESLITAGRGCMEDSQSGGLVSLGDTFSDERSSEVGLSELWESFHAFSQLVGPCKEADACRKVNELKTGPDVPGFSYWPNTVKKECNGSERVSNTNTGDIARPLVAMAEGLQDGMEVTKLMSRNSFVKVEEDGAVSSSVEKHMQHNLCIANTNMSEQENLKEFGFDAEKSTSGVVNEEVPPVIGQPGKRLLVDEQSDEVCLGQAAEPVSIEWDAVRGGTSEIDGESGADQVLETVSLEKGVIGGKDQARTGRAGEEINGQGRQPPSPYEGAPGNDEGMSRTEEVGMSSQLMEQVLPAEGVSEGENQEEEQENNNSFAVQVEGGSEGESQEKGEQTMSSSFVVQVVEPVLMEARGVSGRGEEKMDGGVAVSQSQEPELVEEDVDERRMSGGSTVEEAEPVEGVQVKEQGQNGAGLLHNGNHGDKTIDGKRCYVEFLWRLDEVYGVSKQVTKLNKHLSKLLAEFKVVLEEVDPNNNTAGQVDSEPDASAAMLQPVKQFVTNALSTVASNFISLEHVDRWYHILGSDLIHGNDLTCLHILEYSAAELGGVLQANIVVLQELSAFILALKETCDTCLLEKVTLLEVKVTKDEMYHSKVLHVLEYYAIHESQECEDGAAKIVNSLQQDDGGCDVGPGAPCILCKSDQHKQKQRTGTELASSILASQELTCRVDSRWRQFQIGDHSELTSGRENEHFVPQLETIEEDSCEDEFSTEEPTSPSGSSCDDDNPYIMLLTPLSASTAVAGPNTYIVKLPNSDTSPAYSFDIEPYTTEICALLESFYLSPVAVPSDSDENPSSVEDRDTYSPCTS